MRPKVLPVSWPNFFPQWRLEDKFSTQAFYLHISVTTRGQQTAEWPDFDHDNEGTVTYFGRAAEVLWLQRKRAQFAASGDSYHLESASPDRLLCWRKSSAHAVEDPSHL